MTIISALKENISAVKEETVFTKRQGGLRGIFLNGLQKQLAKVDEVQKAGSLEKLKEAYEKDGKRFVAWFGRQGDDFITRLKYGQIEVNLFNIKKGEVLKVGTKITDLKDFFQKLATATANGELDDDLMAWEKLREGKKGE